MQVRAKLQVQRITQLWSGPGAQTVEVSAMAVAGKANEPWSRWTPAGELRLSITNPDAFSQFKLGQYLYVDMTEAPEKDEAA